MPVKNKAHHRLQTSTMAFRAWPLLAITAVFISACGVYTVTDNIILYPANQSAQSWGVINFYSQYQSNQLPGKLNISLPKGQQLSGQLTYVENSGKTSIDDDGWFNDISIGIGRGFGSGYWGVGWSPRTATYHSHLDKVSLNAFGQQLGLNCQGEFNRRQQAGTLNCKLTNGMQYRGTIRRVTVR